MLGKIYEYDIVLFLVTYKVQLLTKVLKFINYFTSLLLLLLLLRMKVRTAGCNKSTKKVYQEFKLKTFSILFLTILILYKYETFCII